MRGHPPLHLIVFALGFALMAVPLARLTSDHQAPHLHAIPEGTHPGSDPSSVATPSRIRIRTAHPPQSLSLTLNGHEIFPASIEETSPGNLHFQIVLPISTEGVELLLAAVWPPGTPDTAVTVEIEPDGLDAKSQTRWSSGGRLTEALVFQW